ncbi:MAG: alpha-E domain-containing protein [Lachnospiraceae bacterium]|nr:alpha-E domain-containing protein [Lachnospiraceae bacterium]MEE1014410.1 alpha-E domain-containing protein [Lachnospiraceae bacterium]
MGIISVEQADRLFWLGRYSERVYTTLKLYSSSFDELIDGIADKYEDFCRKIDIPDVYGSKEVFLTSYPFDENNPDSVISNLMRAYDNAIELRDEIGSEVISYIQLAIYAMNKAKISGAPLIEMQKVIDNILAFWGIADDEIDSEHIRNIIKTGKRIERIDLYARLQISRRELVREVDRLMPRVERSGLTYDSEKLTLLKELVDAPEIDYYRVVREVESIL